MLPCEGNVDIFQHGQPGRQGLRGGSCQHEGCLRNQFQPKERTMQLNSYLFFNGQCETAFKFYEQCLGGKIAAMLTHAGTPAEENVPPEWRNKILHARLTVGDSVLMGSDAPPGH